MAVFQIMRGSHTGPNLAGKEEFIQAGARDGGDTIETNQNLLLCNGPHPMEPKFRLVTESGPVDRAGLLREKERIEKQLAQLDKAQIPAAPIAAAKFEDMDEKELREWAEDNEIDVTGADTKEELIAAIKG